MHGVVGMNTSRLNNNSPQPLSDYGIYQINMESEPINTQNFGNQMAPKTTFVGNTEPEKYVYSSRISIETEPDGEGFCAFSQKYHRFLGYGKTKDEAVAFFIESFKDKKYGEQLSNYHFYYDI